jgi:hypothetical protein
MKYYIPSSTLNISNILSSGSISPYSYYGKRKFGIKTFEPIKECEKFKNQIILFGKYPLFSIISDKESYPMCIEIDIPDNLVVQSNLPDIYYTSKTIYVSPSNVSFVFESEEIMNKSLFWIDISDEAKFYSQYKSKFILSGGINETFNLTSSTLNGLIIEQTSDVEAEVMIDWKNDKIRGTLCGLFIGANGFEGIDRTGVGYQRNKIKNLMSQLLHIFNGHVKLVSLTCQLQESALSEFVKKEQNVNQICSMQESGRLNVLYNEDKDVRIDFYNQLLNRILDNSESLTQQALSQEGGKLLSTLYGNRWKYSSDYNYLIQLYNNVTRYDIFDLSSNESVILRSFAAFVQRGLGEWDKLRDYLSEREMSLPDRRFIYGLYGAINGFSTLSKTLTDTADISDKAIVDFIIDMNGYLITYDDYVNIEKGIQEYVKYDSELASENNKEGEQLEVADEVGLHVWQKGIKDYAVEKAIKRDKKKLISALEEALIENGKNADYFVFLKLLATYEGWAPTGKGPNAVWVRMQEHFVPDYFSRMGIVNPKATLKSVKDNNSPSLFGPSFEENGENTNIKRPFFEDNNAWETIRTMVPLQIRERTQNDFTWLQQEYKKGEHSKYYAKASRDNATVIEALRRLLLKKEYIKGMFEKEIEQIIQYLHQHYDLR